MAGNKRKRQITTAAPSSAKKAEAAEVALRTSNGVLLDDPERATTPVAEWSDDELKAWGLYELPAAEFEGNNLNEELAREARIRFDYPAGWPVATIRDVLAGGARPETTSNGLLAEDITREAKSLAEWSAAELFALYNGELISKYNYDDPEFVEAVRTVVAKIEEQHDTVQWTEEQLLNWLLTRRVPTCTERGNYTDSATRPDKAVSEWTDSELIDWLDRKIGATADQHAELLPEVHKRFKLDDSIVADDALIVINGGELPRSASGVQLRDIIRDQKLPEDWTKEELTAWARNEIPVGDRCTVEQLRLELAYAYELEEHATVEQVLAFIDKGLPPPKALTFWKDAELEEGLKQEPDSVAYKAELLRRARHNAPKAWSDEECIVNFRTNERPPKTSNGVWVNDVTRSQRIASGWPVEELKAWGAGEIALSDEDEAKLVDYLRMAYPDTNSYYLQDLKAYFASNTMDYAPKVEGTDIQLRDRLRDARSVKEWSVEEMRLAFNDVIERPFGLVEEMRERVQAPLSWSYDQYTKAFMDPTYTPERTESGHWLNDAVRDNRPMEQWTDEEVIGLITGEITSKTWTREMLVSVVRKRRQFAAGVSDEAALKAFAEGTDPHHEAAHEEATQEALKPPVDTEPALSKLHRYANGKLVLNAAELAVYVVAVRDQYGIEPTWSDKTIIDWVGKLVDFNITRDVMLRFLLPELWSADDLRRWLNGELDFVGGPNKTQLMYQVRRRFIVPDDIDDDEVRAYLFEKNKQTITHSGVIVDDPKREFLSASKWSKDELLAWCTGEIQGTKGTTDATLRAAVTANWGGILPEWSLQQVKTFVVHGELPPKTSTGVWVVDITREDKVPGAWSQAELKAWVLNEIKVVKYTAEQVLRAVRVVFRLSDKWTDAEVIEFIALGNAPQQADTVLISDPTRERRYAEEWTEAELRAWARGKISATHLAPAHKLFAVIRTRYGDPAWSDEQVIAKMADGTIPPTASTGAWVTDIQRDKKTADEWQMAELRAWAMGEIVSGKNVTDKALLVAGRKAISILVDGSVAQWSDQEVHRWLKTGAKPIKTTGGHFKGCPRRAQRGAQEWSKTELIDFIKGELSATAKASVEELWQAVYVKWELPMAWSQSEAKAYVLFDRTPAKTADGLLWIRDTLRELKPAAHWNAEELKAWARGELTATKAAPEADLVAEARIRYHLSEKRAGDSLKRLLATLKEEPLKMSIQFIAQNLESYAKGMGMGVKVNELEAAGFQTQLYHTMTRCLTLDGRDFTEGWTKILDFIHNNANGMFATERAYRGIQQLRMSDRDKKNFEALLDLAIRTSDPSTRYASAKRTNLEVSLRGIPNEGVRQLVRAYYQVH